MSTYREAVYLCIDFIKSFSDDATIVPEHVAYLIDKQRAYLLRQIYGKDPKKAVPTSNYQTVKLNLVAVPALSGFKTCGFDILKSEEKIPAIMKIGNPKIILDEYVIGNMITLVDNDRFQYVGNNKYLNNIIYATIGNDGYLYLKSNNIQYLYLKHIMLSGVFEDPSKLNDILAGCDCENCDFLDTEIPIEETLLIPLLEAVITELKSAIYTPQDPANNANDDLADVAAFIRQNMKDRYIKDTQQ